MECDNFVDSTKSPPPADCGFFGGWPYLAYEFIEKQGGARLVVAETFIV